MDLNDEPQVMWKKTKKVLSTEVKRWVRLNEDEEEEFVRG